MKKTIALLLLTLLLAGCTVNSGETTETPTEPAQTQPLGYQPSEMEEKTRGGVLLCRTEGEIQDFVLLEGKPLLLDGAGNLTLLGESGLQEAQLPLDQPVSLEDITVYNQQIAVYLRDSRQVLVLNDRLEQQGQIPLPEEADCPVVSLKNGKIYYCVPGQVRVLDMETGFSAPLRSFGEGQPELTGSFFDGDVLACRVGDSQEVLYIKADTGQSTEEDVALLSLSTWQERYFCRIQDGMVEQQVVGTRGGEAQRFTADLTGKTLLPVLGSNGLLTCQEDSQVLELYDLETGKMTGRVDMSPAGKLLRVYGEGQYLYLLMEEGEIRNLYRWEPAKTPVNQEALYRAPLYTKDNPDTEGLEQCQTRIDELNRTYGVQIRITQPEEAPGDYGYTTEYQVEAIETTLDGIEQVLSSLPGYFATKSTGGLKLCIELVRTVEAPCAGALVWDGRTPHVFVPAMGQVQQELLLGLGAVVDSRVMGNSRELDNWNGKYNPEGFAYALSYEVPEDLEAYLEGENPAFVNEISMSYPTEDRKQIFYYAMTEAGADKFQGEALQNKLIALCAGIREAFGWNSTQEAFPWEQYLQTPMTPEN